MNKTAVELLRTNASYIDALKEAIDRWEKSNDTEEKRDLLAAIGEIPETTIRCKYKSGRTSHLHKHLL